MRKLGLLGIVISLLAGCMLVVAWSTFASDSRAGGPLQSDLRKAVALTDAVVAAAGPGAAVTPVPSTPISSWRERCETTIVSTITASAP